MTTHSQVLYRKWRPPRFADIVGQGPITQTLSQAVATGRLAHAYLFCGPRGTGKTSTARVVAKAVNCLGRADGAGDPDGTCAICTAIDAGAFIDLIEIDAASNRGIDEMRDLREKVRFAPGQGAYKVYIIDEAHALTPDAFNAFLKTLEEPPPNTIFILATTEPHKLPATIISRCQRFDFRRISTSDVAERLMEIATSEGINAESEAVHSIARAAGGSLRDATNLLDQLITSFGVHLTLEQVRDVLGIAGEERAIALVKHLLSGNTPQALELINATASEGLDLRPLHRMTVDLLRAALLLKSGVRDSLELSREAQTELGGLAPRVPLEQIMRALRIFGGVTLKHDQPSPLPLELAAVELSLEPEPAHVVQVQAPAPPSAPARQPQPPAQQREPAPRPQSDAPAQPRPTTVEGRAPAPQTNGATSPATEIDPSAPADERLINSWSVILRAMGRVPRKRYDIGALLRSSRERAIEDGVLVVRFPHQSNTERLQEELADPSCRLAVEEVLSQTLGGSFTLRVETVGTGPKGGAADVDHGHMIRAAMNLGGQVVEGTVAEAPASMAPVVEDTVPEAPAPVASVVEDGPPELPTPVAPVVEDTVLEAPAPVALAQEASPEETADEVEAAPTQGEPQPAEAGPADPAADR